MRASTELILPNVVLTCLTTDKFKTGCLSVNLLTPLDRETASLNALIPAVLCRGTATLPDMAAISAKLDSLYGARIRPLVRKKGEVQAIGLYADFADEAFLPAGTNILEEMVALVSEMLLLPRTHGGLFLRAHARDFLHMRAHQHDVYAKGTIRQLPAFANLSAQVFGIQIHGGDDTQPARVGNSGGQPGLGYPGHAPLKNRIAQPKRFRYC